MIFNKVVGIAVAKSDFRERIQHHLKYTIGAGLRKVTLENASKQELFEAISLALKEKIIDQWGDTNEKYTTQKVKQTFYFSLEFLMGRALGNNLLNLNAIDAVKNVLDELGFSLNDIEDAEMDAGLGNGGLGRLAACYLESSATQRLPVHGYGLLYDYGIFIQKIRDGYQKETPDRWLANGNPWLLRNDRGAVTVRMYGQIKPVADRGLRGPVQLGGYEGVNAVPFNMPIVGYDKTGQSIVNTLRLWSTSTSNGQGFDMEAFDKGDYVKAFEKVTSPDTNMMSAVLYPNDNHDSGKELRLKQQHILVSASLQDIIRKYKAGYQKEEGNWDDFADKTALQINDTHPSLIIPELMSILIDKEGVAWEKAREITQKAVAYTNHTVLPEALETWNADMMKKLLPRQYSIIDLLNLDFCNAIRKQFPGDEEKVRRMSIIQDGKVRMAHLAVVGSHAVNGVAELHSAILKESLLKDFNDMFPEKFTNVTNGVTVRRWVMHANARLAELITEKIGDGWKTDAAQLKQLEKYADDAGFLKSMIEIKQDNKKQFAQYVYEKNPIYNDKEEITARVEVDPTSIFDVQAKRLHEYKRQILDALHILALYKDLKDHPDKVVPKRTFFFAAKAAPGYAMAKNIIKFINMIARRVNNDLEVRGLIKVVFLDNYSVSLAEKLIPAADLSEQISLAGQEASGTGNMKFALNGALTIGTMDGANVEMAEEFGEENMFVFGMRKNEVEELKKKGYKPRDVYNSNHELKAVIDQLYNGVLSTNDLEAGILRTIADDLLNSDRYMVLQDFASYQEAQAKASVLYMDQAQWARMTVLNIARSGKFSSDRSVMEYADNIWGLKPVE